MSELVSVIVPIYKTEKYLKKCINSIIAQTYEKLEILLIDDGSPDKCGDICDEYSKADTRIKSIHKKNGGLSDARNVGIDLATGKYIMFCDSDDWIERDIISIAVSEMEKTDIQLLVWGFSADFVDSEENVKSSRTCLTNQFINTMAMNAIDNETVGLLGYAWNKLYIRDLIINSQIYFEKGTSLIEDVLFNAQVIKKCNALSIIGIVGTHYIQRDRISLGKSYYPNYSEMVYRAIKEKEGMLIHLNCNDDSRIRVISTQIILYLKGAIIQIINNNNISSLKIERLNTLLCDEYTQKLVKVCKINSFYDCLFLILVKLRVSHIFLLSTRLRKID